MTTPCTGTASLRPSLSMTVTIPSNITTSVFSLSGLTAAQLVSPAEPVTPSVIVSGLVTTVPDAPGFTPIANPQPGSQAQIDAIRSAAANTAAAYDIDESFSIDIAAIQQKTISQQIAQRQPTVIIEQFIIPP